MATRREKKGNRERRRQRAQTKHKIVGVIGRNGTTPDGNKRGVPDQDESIEKNTNDTKTDWQSQ